MAVVKGSLIPQCLLEVPHRICQEETNALLHWQFHATLLVVIK